MTTYNPPLDRRAAGSVQSGTDEIRDRLFAQYPGLPMQTQVLARQLLGGLPDALRPLLLLVQLLVEFADRPVPPADLPVEPGDVLAQRLDRDPQARLFRGRPIRAGFRGVPSDDVFRALQLRPDRAQLGDFLDERLDRADLARPNAGFGKQSLQACHGCLQQGRGLCRTAQVLRLLDGLAQPASAGREARLLRTGIATGGHFGPAQLFTARFRRLRPRPLLLIKGLEIVRFSRCRPLGRRPNPVVALDQCRLYREIIVQNRHALDNSARQIVLPAPLWDLDSMGMVIQMRDLHGLNEQLRASTPDTEGSVVRDAQGCAPVRMKPLSV